MDSKALKNEIKWFESESIYLYADRFVIAPNGACKKRCAFKAIGYPGTQPFIKCIEVKSNKIRAMFFTLCYS